MNLQVTDTYEKLNKHVNEGYHFIIMQGSSSAGKTFAALHLLVILALDIERCRKILIDQQHAPPLDIFIIRNTMTSSRASVFADFQKILTGLKLWDESRCNQRDMTYQLGLCKFTFFGLDKQAGVDKARGARSDICFMNEINQISFEIGKEIAMRNKVLFIGDFNPQVPANHWIYTFLCQQYDGKKPQFKRFIVTYKDNFYCPPNNRITIESYDPSNPDNVKRGTADEVYWKIFGQGQRATIEGFIYPEHKWRVVEDWPQDVKIAAYGMDFGFTNDPTTLVQVGYGKDDKMGFLYLKELLYKTDLYPRFNQAEPNHGSIERELELLGISKDIPIFADSENPTAIDEIRSLGYNILKAHKPPDSVRVGIDMCRKFSFKVIGPSLNLVKELSSYKWKINKEGRGINEPCKGFDHLCDAFRYVVFMTNDRSGFSHAGNKFKCYTKKASKGLDRYESDSVTINGYALDTSESESDDSMVIPARRDVFDYL